MDASIAERVAKLEVLTSETRTDVAEIKADVKLLLQSKWRAEGRNGLVAAVTALIVGLFTSLWK